LREQPTLHLCLGAQQSTRTPAATDCDDCVRLFVGGALGICLEVRSFRTQCKPTQLISNTKCCRSHFTGKFWIVLSIVLILPRLSSFVWFAEASPRGLRLHDNERVDVVICERFRMRKPGFHGNGIFKLVPRWGMYISVFRDYVKKL